MGNMKYGVGMGKHIQIREIPDDMHAAIKARAAAQGVSMSEYLKRLIARDLKLPNWDAIRARSEGLEPVVSSQRIVEIIREERERR